MDATRGQLQLESRVRRPIRRSSDRIPVTERKPFSVYNPVTHSDQHHASYVVNGHLLDVLESWMHPSSIAQAVGRANGVPAPTLPGQFIRPGRIGTKQSLVPRRANSSPAKPMPWARLSSSPSIPSRYAAFHVLFFIEIE